MPQSNASGRTGATLTPCICWMLGRDLGDAARRTPAASDPAAMRGSSDEHGRDAAALRGRPR